MDERTMVAGGRVCIHEKKVGTDGCMKGWNKKNDANLLLGRHLLLPPLERYPPVAVSSVLLEYHSSMAMHCTEPAQYLARSLCHILQNMPATLIPAMILIWFILF